MMLRILLTGLVATILWPRLAQADGLRSFGDKPEIPCDRIQFEQVVIPPGGGMSGLMGNPPPALNLNCFVWIRDKKTDQLQQVFFQNPNLPTNPYNPTTIVHFSECNAMNWRRSDVPRVPWPQDCSISVLHSPVYGDCECTEKKCRLRSAPPPVAQPYPHQPQQNSNGHRAH